MKTFMLRGRVKKAYMPKSLEYGKWYNFVTPFDWQYFKIKKSSRFVSVYSTVSSQKPDFTVSKKRFLELLTFAKSTPEQYDPNKPDI